MKKKQKKTKKGKRGYILPTFTSLALSDAKGKEGKSNS